MFLSDLVNPNVSIPVILPELVVAVVLDRGRDEGDLRVGGDVEEVVGADVVVALLVAGVDAGDLDRDVHRGVARVVTVDGGGAVELVERTTHLRHHRVPRDEAETAVRRVDRVGAGEGAEVRGGRGGHGVVPLPGYLRVG